MILEMLALCRADGRSERRSVGEFFRTAHTAGTDGRPTRLGPFVTDHPDMARRIGHKTADRAGAHGVPAETSSDSELARAPTTVTARLAGGALGERVEPDAPDGRFMTSIPHTAFDPGHVAFLVLAATSSRLEA